MPIALAKSTMLSTTAGSVSTVPMTSAVLKRAHTFAQRNAAAIAKLQARGLADPTLDPFGTAHAMKAMVSPMASLVFIYGFDMSFDALAEMLLQLWTNALRIPPVLPSP